MKICVATLLALLYTSAGSGAMAGRYGAVAPGGAHTCAIADDGHAVCWGKNDNGQLGTGLSGPAQSRPQPVAGGTTYARLTAGANHTCGMTADGIVQCWGYGAFGQLGNKSLANSSSPVNVETSLRFVEIAAGFAHTCGIAQGGSVYCWGDARTGQLGNGVTGGATPAPSPARTPAGMKFTHIGAGGTFSCALSENGVVYCWGSNAFGELGTASVSGTCQTGRTTTPCSSTPVPVGGAPLVATGDRRDHRVVPPRDHRVGSPNGLRAKYLAVGQGHSCVITMEGMAACWGRSVGPTPVPAAEGHRFAMLSVGSGHACGLEGGSVWCWGSNVNGKLGNGSNNESASPVAVSGGLTFGSVRAGFNHTCGISTSQSILCWGANYDGQLGNGSQDSSPIPVPVQ